MTHVGAIKEIWRFPVKSMFGETVTSARIERQGLPEDRQWALRDEESGELTNGKKIPKIMTLKARYLEKPALGFGVAADTPVEIEFPDGRTTSSVDPFASALLSLYLGRRVTLVPRLPAREKKHYKIAKELTLEELRYYLGVAPDDPDPDLTHFSIKTLDMISKYMTPPGTYYDVHPLQFITTASFDHMAAQYPAGDFRVERFRPTFVIETDPSLEGFVENAWQGGRIKVGDSIITCGHPTIRCSMPGAAQPGILQDPKIPHAVQAYAGRNLGLYASARRSGTIHVGDPVEFIAPASGKIFSMWQHNMRKVKSVLIDQLQKSIERKAAKTTNLPTKTLPKGFERHRLVRKEIECDGVMSFYFQRVDGAMPPTYIPGQHIVLALQGLSKGKILFRPYSLSDAARGRDHYRISVKRDISTVDGERVNGAASSYLQDRLTVGDILHIKGPAGRFGCVPSDTNPLILVAGGIGITPFVATLKTLAIENPSRETHLFYGIRHLEDYVFAEELETCIALMPNLQIHLFVSQGAVSVSSAITLGRLSADLIAARLKVLNDYQYFICGNPAFTEALRKGLVAKGIAENKLFHESFMQARSVPCTDGDGKSYAVKFSKSDTRLIWTPRDESLLSLAENAGIDAASGCRYGAC